MKIRTITTGFNLKLPLKEEQIGKISNFTNNSKRIFENKGYTVQTVRIATQPGEDYFKSKDQIVRLVKKLEDFTHRYNIDFFNIGTTINPKHIQLIYDIIKGISNGFCSVTISDKKQINYEAARQTARLMKRLSIISKYLLANLRFKKTLTV